MSYYQDDVTRDGFAYACGRFFALPGRVERVEGSDLERMFLPRLTPEGQKLLNAGRSDEFVRGQLKHYGVHLDNNKISGNGTLLLKKVLQAGKCDKVPDRITKLREQMHTEWLGKQSPKQLSNSPELVMERYFLSSGKPDRTKTTTVVGIPFDPNSSRGADKMHEAATNVTGLHDWTALGPKTQTVFMGWDSVAVKKAARGHAAKEKKELQAAEDERENKRQSLHTDYLDTLKRKRTSKDFETCSPVGSYMVDCKEIEEGYLDEKSDLSLDIHQTKTAGIFQASFDFGALVGVMIISADEEALQQYCSQLDRSESDDEEDEDENEEEWDDEDDVKDYRKHEAGSKRKAEAPRGRGRPPKKSKVKAAQPRNYFLRLKCRETGEGQVYPDAERGSIKFKDESLSGFIGKANLPCIGRAIPFSTRKISDVPTGSEKSWADYSDAAYHYANVNRWR